MTKVTAYFARQLVFDGFLRGVVPLQVMMSIDKVDILLVEDGSPLERRGWATGAVSPLISGH